MHKQRVLGVIYGFLFLFFSSFAGESSEQKNALFEKMKPTLHAARISLGLYTSLSVYQELAHPAIRTITNTIWMWEQRNKIVKTVVSDSSFEGYSLTIVLRAITAGILLYPEIHEAKNLLKACFAKGKTRSLKPQNNDASFKKA